MFDFTPSHYEVVIDKSAHGKVIPDVTNGKRNDLESSSVEVVARGISNYGGSCWMDSVIQAVRASSAFREIYAPKPNENGTLRSELFRLFTILEGINGERKRSVRNEETKHFKQLLIDLGLPIKMDGAFLEEPFLDFLLKKLHEPQIEYLHSSKKSKKQERILTIPLKQFDEPRHLQSLIKDLNILFVSDDKVPVFLPIYLKRPKEKIIYPDGSKAKESARVPVIPTTEIQIPVGKNKKALYQLVSIVIGRDSKSHAYTYGVNHDIEGREIWIEYNDIEVFLHTKPYKEKRRTKSKLSPFEDACKHAGILIYQFTGYA